MLCDVSPFKIVPSTEPYVIARNPDDRPSAAELRKHSYLTLPQGWMFNGFKQDPVHY
jgi:hypothetical protein